MAAPGYGRSRRSRRPMPVRGAAGTLRTRDPPRRRHGAAAVGGGGMAFCWFTTRRREVGLGYGWLLRGIYAADGRRRRSPAGAGVRRRPGARGGRRSASPSACLRRARRVDRPAQGPACAASGPSTTGARAGRGDDRHRARRRRRPTAASPAPTGPSSRPCSTSCPSPSASSGSSPPPSTPAATRSCRSCARWPAPRSSARSPTPCCSATGTSCSPGLPRRLLNELVDALGWVWPIEVVALLLPTGMISVWTGAVDDGWNGTLGWFWAACAVTTIVLVFVTKAALREREYSAVMAATGPALPGDPHRVRHRPRRPRRARRLTPADATERLCGASSVVACPGPSGVGRSASGWSRSRSSCSTPSAARACRSTSSTSAR